MRVCLSTSVVLFASISAFLYFHGPFYFPSAAGDNAQVTTEYLPGDGSIATLIGRIDKTTHSFLSVGKPGPLVYGPYVDLPPGSYKVTWYGTSKGTEKATFQLFSGTAGGVLIRRKGTGMPNYENELASVAFGLNKRVPDLEFRTLVDDTSEVSVTAVRLTAFGSQHD